MTTVNLIPTNLDQISFGTSFNSSLASGFYILLDTLNFNENQRREILYSETKLGGKAVNFKDNLTPLEFQCIVFGTDRNQMLQRSEELALAVGNVKGGFFEYQPDGVTTSTFYTYEASAKPQLSSQKLNRWDDISREHGVNAMIFDVVLQTQPIAHSQVFDDITPSRTTLNNWGTYNYFDLLDIKGDIPALVQVTLTNPNASTLNRFYICSRSAIYSSLASIVSWFEGESADYTIGTWANQADVSRSNGSYKRLTGSGSTWGSLLFDLPSITNYEGLITILPVVRSSNASVVCRSAIYLNNTLVWASPNQYAFESANKWQLLYAGEFNFPPLIISDDTNATLQLAVEFLGTGNVDVDAVQIMYSDEAIAQVDITVDGSYGVVQNSKLLLETDLDYIRKAIVTDGSDTVQRLAKSIYGTISSCIAIKDTRVYVLFQRLSGTDYHVPADTLNVATRIIYRTTYPFRD